jgi:uncharacterized protein YacL
MVLNVLRALFILLMAAVGWFFIQEDPNQSPDAAWLRLVIALVVAVFIVCVDILAPRRKLAVFSGSFLGLLVGICIAFALSFVTSLVIDQAIAIFKINISTAGERDLMVRYINLLIGVISCYLSISFILQTKDDFRFVIPYVEFSKQTKGARPMLLDTSVLIDGRINEIVATGFIDSQLIVPQFVIDELQLIADSGDRLKRNRGRRGLDVLQKLRTMPTADVAMYDTSAREPNEPLEVDQRLVQVATETHARVLTNDFNLIKVAQLRGVDVININDLAVALKPVALPGEKMTVRLIKPGDAPGQGVGYLEDGTMVVVEQSRQYLGDEVEFTVTNMVQNKQGKMIFGRLIDVPSAAPARRPKQKPEPPTEAA